MKFEARSSVMVSIFMLSLFSCACAARFGPNNCVNLFKSQTGSCVMSTDCVGIDTSKFEFTFDCETSPGERLRHSFGVGGFDEQEEFDTSIKCSKCIAPETQIVSAHEEVTSPHPAVHTTESPTSASQASEANMASRLAVAKSGRMDSRGTVEEDTHIAVHFLAGKKEEKKEEAKVVTYGPKDCVSTWRDSKSGHCQVKTNCTGIDTTQYMFGLICENDDGKTRHLFGKDSFDSEEEFDTLIPCKTCLALDNVTKATELEAENAELATEVNALASEVKSVKETYQGLEKDVGKLNTAVSEKAGGAKKEEKSEEKKEGEEEKKEGGEEKKEGEKKESEKKDEEKKDEGEAAKTEFYLTDRDVDENLPSDAIVKSHLKDSSSNVKKHRSSSQKNRRQRRQKSRDVEADDDNADADDEESPPQGNFRRTSHQKAEQDDSSDDDSDDSSDDQNDD